MHEFLARFGHGFMHVLHVSTGPDGKKKKKLFKSFSCEKAYFRGILVQERKFCTSCKKCSVKVALGE